MLMLAYIVGAWSSAIKIFDEYSSIRYYLFSHDDFDYKLIMKTDDQALTSFALSLRIVDLK